MILPLRYVSRHSGMLLLFVVAILLFSGKHAPAQGGQLKQRSPDVRRIIVDVIAKPRLEANAVVVTDNGVRVPTEHLRLLSSKDGTDAQVQVVFVIDAVNSTFLDVTRSEDAVQSALKALPRPLQQLTSVIVLSDTPAEHSARGTISQQETTSLHARQLFAHRIPATRDASVLIAAIDSYKIGFHRILQSQSGVDEAERVQLSLQALSFIATAEGSVLGPKVVLWISPGWPFLSKSNATSSGQLFDSIVYFSDAIRSARIILYSISPEGITNQDHSAETEGFLLSTRPNSIRANGHAPEIPVELTDTYYQNFLKGVRSASQSNPNDLALQVLAYQSGGLVLRQNNDLKSQIIRCESDAENISSLAFDPGDYGSATTYHAVEVKRLADAQPLRTQAGFYTR